MADNINAPDGGGDRKNVGKTRHELAPAYAQEQYCRVLTFGATKYSPQNWRRGMSWSTVIASMKRHIQAIEEGQDYDSDSGILHSAHVMCNAAFLTEYYKIYPNGDDRRHKYLRMPKIGLDIDEVICDFTAGWAALHGVDAKPESWNYHREMLKVFDDMKQKGELDDFYINLSPKINPSDIHFEPHVYVTSRPVDTAITEQWLDKHKFPASKVITVKLGESKIEALKNSGVDIFVDDRFENFVEINNAGICCYLFDAAHNQRYDVGYKRIKSLKELL